MEEPGCQNVPEDPVEEVKKLQELVRKLEHQNQQLRNRQNVSDSREEKGTTKSSKHDTNAAATTNVPRTPLRPLDSRLNPNGVNIDCDDSGSSDQKISGGERRESRKSGVLDDVDLINIEDLDVSDEDSWLYMSPKGLSSEERSVSPYKWLRKDVEDPQNKELQLARRALAYKLDESAILMSHRSPESSPFNHSLQGKPPIGRVIDSRTFTRGKKKRTPFEEGNSTLPVIESLRDEDEDEEEHQNGPGSYLAPLRSTEVIDVQEIARMQEESLRQSSPSTPKRISQSSISDRRWSCSSKNSMSDNEEVFPVTPVVDGGTLRQDTVTLAVHEPSAAFSNSAHSSPPDSFHGSNSSLDNGTDSFRHSLPNLCKGYGGSRSLPRQVGKIPVEVNGSPGRHITSGSKLSSMARTSAIQGDRRLGLSSRSASNLRSPSTTHRVQRQVANGSISPPFLTPPALSPTTSRHPPPSLVPKPSGLPRLSRIPAPRSRSGIPVSRTPGENDAADNELWSDGCY